MHYKCDRGLRFVCSSYKSITIRCVKCQIFGVWHTKHQKILLMRYSKSYKFWHTWTILFDLWNNTDRCAKKIFISSLFFYYFSFFSLLLFLLSSSVCSLSLITPFSLFLLLSSQHLHHMASGFFFSIHFLCTSFSLFYLFFPITLSLSLSLSLLSIAFIADLHSSRPIPFTTSHLVMTKSWSASTITLSPSLSTLVSTKKKAILIRYSQMCLRDSGG